MPQTDGASLAADSLLDIARADEVRSTLEERFSDYCHACSNRLNSLKLSLYLAQRQPAGRSDRLLQTARERYQLLEQQFELFRAVCRPLKLSPVRLDLALLIEDRRASWTKVLAGQGVQLVVEPPGRPVEVWLDADRLGRALDAMVEWRGRVCRPGVVATLDWGRRNRPGSPGLVYLAWREFDLPAGKGVVPDPSLVSTWALPVLTRVVTEHGGSVSCREKDGWQAEILWPSRDEFGSA